MEFDIYFIFAQVCALIATVLSVLTFFMKKRYWYLVLQILCNMFYAVNYFLLGAVIGGVLTCVSVIRSTTFFFFVRKGKTPELSELVFFESLYIGLGIITFGAWFSILMLIAKSIHVFAVWQKNRAVLMVLQIIVSILTIVYNIMAYSYVGVLVELASMSAAIISLILIVKGLRKKKSKTITDANFL